MLRFLPLFISPCGTINSLLLGLLYRVVVVEAVEGELYMYGFRKSQRLGLKQTYVHNVNVEETIDSRGDYATVWLPIGATGRAPYALIPGTQWHHPVGYDPR